MVLRQIRVIGVMRQAVASLDLQEGGESCLAKAQECALDVLFLGNEGDVVVFDKLEEYLASRIVKAQTPECLIG